MAKTCNGCSSEKKTKTPDSVPYLVHETAMARAERTQKRLFIAIVVLIIAILLCNFAWLYAWNQYDYTSEEIIVEQDAKDGGNANYVGNDGDILNGLSESNDSQKNSD